MYVSRVLNRRGENCAVEATSDNHRCVAGPSRPLGGLRLSRQTCDEASQEETEQQHLAPVALDVARRSSCMSRR